MGLFDNLKNMAQETVRNAAVGGNKTVEVTFPVLPETPEGFKALPQSALNSPFETAALTVVALCFYVQDAELCFSMLNFLKGPKPLAPREKQFIKDRLTYQDFIPRSYFGGAAPSNDYTPAEPYTIKVSENSYSYNNQGYAKLFIACGGADSPRPITLRKAKDGKWYLWEQFLLSGKRTPESADPWA